MAGLGTGDCGDGRSSDGNHCTMVQNGLVLRHLITHFPTSLGVSKRVNGKVSGPVLTSQFLDVLNRSALGAFS